MCVILTELYGSCINRAALGNRKGFVMQDFIQDCRQNRGMVVVYLGLVVCAGWLIAMASWDLGGSF